MICRRTQRLATAFSAILAVSCSSSNSQKEDTPTPPGFDGVWVDCSNDGSNDMRDVFDISASNVHVASYTYPTTDGSCGGAATPQGTPVSGTMTLGTPGDAWLGDLVVQATPVDFVWAPTYYSIIWRDADVDPNVLYIGDERVDPSRDGSTLEKRPVVLQEWRPRYFQTTPTAGDLNGTWVMACRNNYGADEHEEIAISGSTMTSTTTQYSSVDESCTGSSITNTRTVAFTLGAPTYSTLNGMSVTSLALDIPDETKPFYSVIWVDTRVTPNVLYVGDETATPGYDAGTSATRATVLKSGKPFVKQ